MLLNLPEVSHRLLHARSPPLFAFTAGRKATVGYPNFSYSILLYIYASVAMALLATFSFSLDPRHHEVGTSSGIDGSKH